MALIDQFICHNFITFLLICIWKFYIMFIFRKFGNINWMTLGKRCHILGNPVSSLLNCWMSSLPVFTVWRTRRKIRPGQLGRSQGLVISFTSAFIDLLVMNYERQFGPVVLNTTFLRICFALIQSSFKISLRQFHEIESRM